MKRVKEQMRVEGGYWHKWWAWYPVWITTDTKPDKNGAFKRTTVMIWREWVERMIEYDCCDSYTSYREIKEG